MLTQIVFICALSLFSSVSSSVIEKQSQATDDYFVYPKHRHSDVTPRIIGGKEVTPHAYPFQTALVIVKGNNKYLCGGSLISNQWVLTAAHCIGNPRPDYITVMLGNHDLKNTDAPVVVVNTTNYVVHKDWNSNTHQYDVALVRLPINVAFTDAIQPVQLAQGTNKYEGDKATLLGWGQAETESTSMVLKSVDSTVMNNDDCANMNVNFKKLIKPMHICASGSGMVGSCTGDSGGPLLVDGKQVGIVSFGARDCTLGMPSVYTRVTMFHDWIDEQINNVNNDHNNGHRIVSVSVVITLLLTLCLTHFFK